MEIKLKELIDINQLQSLQDRLNNMYSFPSAIIDNEGNILTSVGWQDICANFHRKYPESAKECTKSDIYILQHLNEANPAVSYICPHGLIDSATPIIIDGIHLGNFFTGQFFLNEKPDIEFFRSQAKKFGYNEKEYLEAVENVPIWTKEKLDQYIEFIKRFIEIIAEIGLKNLREIETNRLLKESEERFKSIVECTSDWYWEINNNGEYSYCSENVEKILGYTPKELIGKTPYHIMPTEEKERVKKYFQKVLNDKSPIVEFENWNLRKDGSLVCLMTNGIPVFNKEGNLTGYKGADKDITEKKKAEQLIKSEKQRLTYILEGSNVGTWEWNVKTGESVFNERWANIIGYSLKELGPLSINTWLKYAHPEDVENSSKLFDMHSKGELDYYECEARMKHKNGNWVWILVRGKVYEWDEDGQPIKMAGTHQDITDRKLAQENLIQSEEKLSEAMRIAKLGHWELDLATNIFTFNDEFYSLLHTNAKEMGGYNLHAEEYAKRFVHPNDSYRVMLETEKAIQSNDPNYYSFLEHPVIFKDGKTGYMSVSIRVKQDSNGKAIKTYGVNQDITERKLHEEALRISEERYALLIQNLEVGIVIHASDTSIIANNKRASEILGLSNDQLRGKVAIDPTWRFLTEDKTPLPIDDYPVNRILADKKPIKDQIIGREQAGQNEIIWATINGFPILNSSGEITEILISFMEITERKKAEEEIEKHRNHLEELVKLRTTELNTSNMELHLQLEKQNEFEMMLRQSLEKEHELNEMKSRFISTTSHEFRTPLTSVLSSTQLLQKFGTNWSEEKKNEHFNRIITSVDYLTHLLDDILTLNRAESGKISYSPEKIDLKEFADDCLIDAKTLITEKHELKFNYRLRQKDFLLDPKLMKFVFNNLLSNASKYSPDGGKIELVISKVKKTLVIEVSDEGIGIPSEDLDKIFDSFYRTKHGEDIAGTGLGLAIVKRAVDLHNGEISVASELEKGSRFIVKIPIIAIN